MSRYSCRKCYLRFDEKDLHSHEVITESLGRRWSDVIYYCDRCVPRCSVRALPGAKPCGEITFRGDDICLKHEIEHVRSLIVAAARDGERDEVAELTQDLSQLLAEQEDIDAVVRAAFPKTHQAA